MNEFKTILLSGLLLGAACDTDPPEYRFGENVTGLRFQLFDDSEGLFPSSVTLTNPRNPFRLEPTSTETRFAILADGGNAASFYVWAANLARVPTGEAQFYTAASLENVYRANEVDDEEEQEMVRQMAIARYQSVLDNFPDSVTFDATGTISFRIATPAYLAIIDLGGRVQGDWVLIETENGPVAVQGGSEERPPPDDPPVDTSTEEEGAR